MERAPPWTSGASFWQSSSMAQTFVTQLECSVTGERWLLE
jgi:hypothetical protein